MIKTTLIDQMTKQEIQAKLDATSKEFYQLSLDEAFDWEGWQAEQLLRHMAALETLLEEMV